MLAYAGSVDFLDLNYEDSKTPSPKTRQRQNRNLKSKFSILALS